MNDRAAAVRKAAYTRLEALPAHLIGEVVDGMLLLRRGGSRLIAEAHTAIMACLGVRPMLQVGVPARLTGRPQLHHGRDIVVPDLAAWPEEQVARHLDAAWPDVLTPSRVCDVLGSDTPDGVQNAREGVYAEAVVRWMWLMRPGNRRFEARELRNGSWTCLSAWNGARNASAPPFDAITISLADLWPLGFAEDPQALYAGDR